MTTIRSNGFNFDQAAIDGLTDAAYDNFLDRFDSTIQEMSSNAVGDQGPNETEDEFADRYHKAQNAVVLAVLRNLVKTLS